MPPWQTLKESVVYLEAGEAVQLCRSLRSWGAYLYYEQAYRCSGDHQIQDDDRHRQTAGDWVVFDVLVG